jgi:hypothetical protein
VDQADGDADTLIVSVALNYARQCSEPVAVLAEDTDIFVLLLHHRQPTMSPMYFLSEAKKGRGGKMVGGKCFDIGEVQAKIGPRACSSILVVHALGGCDTTSSVYGHGKGTIFKVINDRESLHGFSMTLQSSLASPEQVCKAGIDLLLALYGGKVGETLSDLRYSKYCTMSLSKRFQPERLPPSESAARMHSMRVHLQAVIWGTLDNSDIKPTDWGWKLVNGNRLSPIQIDGPIAPDNVITVVRCNCKGTCSSTACSCRKHGLHCVSACGNCRGTACSNVHADSDANVDNDCESDDDQSDTTDGGIDVPPLILDDDIDFMYEEEV